MIIPNSHLVPGSHIQSSHLVPGSHIRSNHLVPRKSYPKQPFSPRKSHSKQSSSPRKSHSKQPSMLMESAYFSKQLESFCFPGQLKSNSPHQSQFNTNDLQHLESTHSVEERESQPQQQQQQPVSNDIPHSTCDQILTESDQTIESDREPVEVHPTKVEDLQKQMNPTELIKPLYGGEVASQI